MKAGGYRRALRVLSEALRSPVTLTFATTLVIVILGLLSGILLARALGPRGRGEVAAALLWPGLLVSIGGFGLSQAIVVFTASEHSLVWKFLRGAIVLGLCLSGLAMFVGRLVLPILLHAQRPEIIHASRIFLLMIPGGMLSGFAVATLQGASEFRRLNFVRLVTPIGYVLGLSLLTLLHGLSVLHVIYLQLALSYFTLLIGLVLLPGVFTQLRLGEVDGPIVKRLLAFGGRAYMGSITSTLNQRLDQTLIAALFPAAQLGLYSVAVSSSSVIDTVGFAFRTVSGPRIAQQPRVQDKFRELTGTLARFLPLALAASAAFALLFPKLIPLLYGSAFSSSVRPAEILLMAQLLCTSKTLLTSSAEAFEDSWLGSKAELLGMVPGLALLTVLLPKLGILGAAIATLVGCIVQLIVMIVGFAKKRHVTAAQASAASR